MIDSPSIEEVLSVAADPSRIKAEKEKRRAASRRWREANREKHREANRRWQKENPERCREKSRRWYWRNREKILAQKKKKKE